MKRQLVYPLQGEQALAVDPRDSVWLSASAGTGKTQVLSARVLRLLLQQGVGPDAILCLTFTKAGAAEMATRVNEVLASWVRMKPEMLAKDLKAIGAPVDADTQERARTLFARVLDCSGGGLRIDTIHAFSQWLLAAFPEEAGLVPGTRAMEDRDRVLLARQVLADMLVEADEATHEALAMLSIRFGADGAQGWLMRCAEAREAWTGPRGWQPPMDSRVKQLLGLPADFDEQALAELCGGLDCEPISECLRHYGGWSAKSGNEACAAISDWLAADPARRLQTLEALSDALFFKNGNPRLPKNAQDGFSAAHEQVGAMLDELRRQAALLALSSWLTPALEVGRRFALAWEEAKDREGLIDFDDQIRRAAALLRRSDLAEWIRYKLDRRFDHILIDEAQDTNAAQWSIIRALTGDFFTGLGQRDGRLRTIFVVGDYKQAIFRFQGTSPENFEIARRLYEDEIGAAVRNADRLHGGEIGFRELRNLGLGRSYRTSQPVLDFVDEAIGAIGVENFGLREEALPHRGFEDPGLVTLWEPVRAIEGEDDEDEDEERDWLPAPERRMADRIAAQVRAWLRDGHPLTRKGRNAGPGDIMVLVRKRRDLAGLIVARLHASGVPVAGVDRLRLGAPLAVKDLLAALRFAAQPLDDLSLASLLVSPLGGWSQEQLLEHGWREQGRLWDHIKASEHPDIASTVALLRDLLARADFEPPQALLHWLLTGPWQGRRKLVARLGREANDPIDELLNAAFAYSGAHTPSLQGFLHWFDAGEGELKREPGGGEGLVRVMTVHGSKGLQAPIVILADATGDPDRSPVRGLSLAAGMDGPEIPLPALTKDEKLGPIAEAEERLAREEREEHWRLLYVAMTRAEEALYIGGALTSREKAPADDSWYARLLPLFGEEAVEDPIWGGRRERGSLGATISGDDPQAAQDPLELPAWATTAVGAEPRPPRPLAPSSVGEEAGANPPLPPEAAREAARRGVLIHRLLERLPDVAPDQREQRARAWLARQGADLPEGTREEMLGSALAVLEEPGFAEIFGPDALAEVPLAALVGGQVIAGTADRLLVTPDKVTVVDFKTARRPPGSLAEVPQSTLRQMAAYAAALERIYPEREIAVAVLYTQTPLLVPIPADVLAEAKTALSTASESFAAFVVE